MILPNSKGLTSPRWLQNEIMLDRDINAVHYGVYENTTRVLAFLSTQDSVDEVIRGLGVVEDTGLDVDVEPGAAVSFDGNYMVDGIWGFSASAGVVFSVVLPVVASITFDTGVGMSNPRIDTVEIRPVQTFGDQDSRNFKDPVTGLVASSLINTRVEYAAEVQILKGTEAASPVAPASTAGWIKLAEVSIAVSQSSIAQNDIVDFNGSLGWTTEASSTIKAAKQLVGSGTSFPSSPTFGDEFYRTDSDAWFKYNGSVWMEI